MGGTTDMEKKREDLISEKRKKLLQRLVEELSREDTDLYYKPTAEIAFIIKSYIDDKTKLSVEERKLLEPLSQHDIQVVLSLH